MDRPWVNPDKIREYSDSEKVKSRSDAQLKFDIARAERYVIYHTRNKFTDDKYHDSIPEDVEMAVILLAEAYAKQAILQKHGGIESERFDDYSYTLKSDTDVAADLGLGAFLDEYILSDNGRIEMRLRRL